MHISQQIACSTLVVPHSRVGTGHPAELSAGSTSALPSASQRSAVHQQHRHHFTVAAAQRAERLAQLCCAADVSVADAACAPADAADTSLGSAAWRQFAEAASGEWSGIAVTYDTTGQAQELPYQYVPQAFREWGAVPKDWHTQCSTLAEDSGMLTKLKRLYPIVGCEADAVAFEEEERRDFQPSAGCEEDAVAFEEESRRSLRSEEQHSTEAKTVLPDGSYSTGPRVLAGLTAARFEHCLVSEPGRRARIVLNVKRDDASQPWRLATLEQHVERRTGDYDGGASLEACGYNMVDVTGEPKPERGQLAGAWDVTSHTAWQLEEGSEAFRSCSAAAPDRVTLPDDALLLHGRMWAAVCSTAGSSSGREASTDAEISDGSGSGSLMMEAGLLVEDRCCVISRRNFINGRLAGTAFTAAANQ